MREMKFRAWNKNKKIMVYKNEDNSSDYWDGVCASIVEVINNELNSEFNKEDYEFMQYTGLKDKNGKEIYEGDIFNLGDNRILYIVEWFDTGLKGRQNGNNSRVGLQYWQTEIEVIGNIYENKELLKEKE